MDMTDKIKSLPPLPGVYIMKDDSGRVLYVGKAKRLKDRVRSYLRPGSDGRAHIRFLMDRAKDLEWVVTASEKEALILENTLIKKHRPRYNIDLKDDKTYLSLRIDRREEFPRIDLVRQVKRDGATYLGPYSSARDLRATVDMLLKLFPLRTCGDRDFATRTRPCLYHWTRGCRAPCTGMIGRKAYGEMVDEVILFLKGKNRLLTRRMKEEMARAAADERYEEAALFRDRLLAVESTLERQKTVTWKPVDRDVIAWTREGAEIQAVVLIVRGGAVIDRRAYHFADVPYEDAEFAADFIRSYYRDERIVPRTVVVQELDPEECGALSEWLSEKSGQRVTISVAPGGEKGESLSMASENAVALLAERRKTKAGFEAALKELGARLALPSPPETIECFDVSLFQGGGAVASMVVFTGGQPDKARYRRFRIRTVEGTDDFAMLYEAVTRRLAKRDEAGWELSDLMVIDGGPGQLGSVLKALSDAGGRVQPVVSLAKARTLPGRGDPEKSPERVFIPGRKNPLTLSRNSSALFMLQRVRDEAHRFAVAFHRNVRKKKAFASGLDGVPGLGPARKKMLLKVFGGVGAVRAATPQEIASKTSLPFKVAKAVVEKLVGKPEPVDQ